MELSGEAMSGSGSIDIRVVTTKSEQLEFIRFQRSVNSPYPAFIPPLEMDRQDFLNPKKHPWRKFGSIELFLAYRSGAVVGRIAAIDDPRYNAFQGTKLGWFGFFDCIEDADVAVALFQAAESWLKARGLTEIQGPACYSMNYEWGVLIDSFDMQPAVFLPYNPPYYPAIIESAGYAKRKDLWAWDIDVHKPLPEKLVRVTRKIQEREGYVIRPVRLKDWDAEIRRLRDIYNSAWEKNWAFVPMTPEEFEHLGKELKLVVKEELVLIAEVHEKAIAFSLTIPDANPAIALARGKLTTYGLPIGLIKLLLGIRKLKRARLIALGIDKDYRKRGIDGLLTLETYLATRRLGYDGGEISWILEDNDLVNRAIEMFGCKRTKTYRIYGKSLGTGAQAGVA